MDITKIQSAGYKITYIAQPGETGPRVLVDWRSPFNKAATNAIKQSFTADQWTQIMLWGKTADAYLIAAVNQFAVEDPRIMCSLVSGLGILRTLCGDGNQYITSNVVPDSKMYIRAIMEFTNSTTAWQFPMTCNMVNASGAEAFGIGKRSGYLFFQYRGDNQTSTRWVSGTTYDFELLTEPGTQILKNDGTTICTLSKSGNCVTTAPIGLFFCNSKDGGVTWKSSANFELFYAEKDDVLEAHYIPCIYNGEKGMLDCANLVFHPNEGTGEFTITEVAS